MLTQIRAIILFFLPGFLLFSSCTGNLSQVTLFEDEFEHLPLGYLSTDLGPATEYHYLPEAGQKGNWTISAFGWQKEYNTAWEVCEKEGKQYLRQNYHKVKENLDPLSPHTHPIIAGGDSIWHDYKIEFLFSPLETGDKSGILFRYQNDRCYYFYGMEGNRLMIKMVQHATAPHRPYEKVLASMEYDWNIGEVYKAEISIRENHFYTLFNDSIILVVDDDTYSRGKIGILSDVPAEFYKVKVSTLKREKRRITRYKQEISARIERSLNENPQPVIWKKIATEGFGAGRNLRFGDLNGDGEQDLLIGQVIHHGPGDAYSELSCLTAMTFDGELLWQKGSPDSKNYHLTNDVAFQIHDLDGDGDKEVIYTMNFRIYIVDGKTGKLIRSIPTPRAKAPADKYERILGDCIFFCDLQGKGRDSDMLIKDRYWNVWAYDEHLKLLWTQSCRTGHYPYARDIDGDSKDEVLIGYSLFNNDGQLLWSLDKSLGDHADGVAIAATGLPADSSLNIYIGASDWGMVIADTSGNIKVHHPIGHVQNPSIANFRSDLPGLEMISINFWGNQGIVNFYDSKGKIYHSFEPGPFGSMCLPVNWKGDGEEYFILNTNPGDGGIFNGWGLLCAVFPDDGHPDMCNAVVDLTGDTRDEIISWDQHEIWVYTQADNPRQGKSYKPIRNPLYNYSNYQFTLSEPGWSE